MAELGARAYLTTDLVLVSTKDAAGKGAEQVCIPYSKGPQLTFINDLVARACSQGGALSPVERGLDPDAPPEKRAMPYPKFLGEPPVADPLCPWCKRRRGEAHQVVRGMEEGDLVDSILEALDRVPEDKLDRIREALEERA